MVFTKSIHSCFCYNGIKSWEHSYYAARSQCSTLLASRIIFLKRNSHPQELDHIFPFSFYILSMNKGKWFCFLLWNYFWWLIDEDLLHKKRYNFLDSCLSILCFCLFSHCYCMPQFFLLEVHRTVLKESTAISFQLRAERFLSVICLWKSRSFLLLLM